MIASASDPISALKKVFSYPARDAREIETRDDDRSSLSNESQR